MNTTVGTYIIEQERIWAHGWPEHPAQLFHVVQLEHFQLLVKRALPHHHVHKLLLAIGAHRQQFLHKNKHKLINKNLQCCWSEIIFIGSGSDFSGNIGSGGKFLSKEAKAKWIFFVIMWSKIEKNQFVLSRFYSILVTKNWRLSDPDPKLIIPDPDPANNFGSDRIRLRIHNAAPLFLNQLRFKGIV